ncbi:lipopolysaccharide biosynthesis protein [Aeromicrobium duanguangcaii]|uniref:Polysaccharide biosynthesis protein n=1 Tax=Aeromicrobium duanguangcaii TaxID=2968086 RepID=A0ABY5KJF5_9ACTN|nr:hypothetical protein [Aeromicrobium duanguangcaii]MCD9153792.1 hypothetical protein [Aeromicrobium duanguangcaii]UUI69130.1 hypothetical protein NP095_03210 [Aeromicrobium duanguangcaii]
MNSLLALLAKGATTFTSMVFGILTARLILGTVGVEHYSLYALLVAIPALLTFSDLGAGAVLVNGVATSDDPRTDPQVRAQLTSVGRIVVCFAAAIQCLNTVLLLTGGWAALLGDAGQIPGAPSAAFACLSVFACGIPLGLWVRIMLGLRRNHLTILLQGLISPLNFLLVRLLLGGGEDLSSYLAMSSYVASFIVGLIGLIVTARMTAPLVTRALRDIPRLRAVAGARVMDVGWPMLAHMIAAPIALSSQRYVVAQFGTTDDVAQYSVAGQVFFALMGLVVAAGAALWPRYARQRAHGDLRHGPWSLSAAFAAGMILASAMIWLVRDDLFGFITSGEVSVPSSTIVAFGAMITCSAVLYPMGMFIMDTPGIRFQVVPALSMAALSFGLSIALTRAMGVEGPPLAYVIATVVCQIIPVAIYIRRHRDRLYPLAPVA